MTPSRRRFVSAGLATLAALSGCSRPDSTAGTPSASGTRPGEADTFDDLTVETDRTRCPADGHWEPYFHRTPMPPPERPSDLTRETVVEYAEAYERFVLTYEAVEDVGRQSPSEPTDANEPAVPEFPDTEMRDRSADVPVSRRDEYVVRMSYTRVVEEESRGAYTVTYYVTPEQTIRAETRDDVTPGPNPAKSGTILEC